MSNISKRTYDLNDKELDAKKVDVSKFNTLATTVNYLEPVVHKLNIAYDNLALETVGGKEEANKDKYSVTVTSDFSVYQGINHIKGGRCYFITIMADKHSTTVVTTFPLYIPLPSETESGDGFNHYHFWYPSINPINNFMKNYYMISGTRNAREEVDYWTQIKFAASIYNTTDEPSGVTKITYIIH